MSSILFILEADALLVANTGEEFTRKGVVSICNMDLSAKNIDTNRTPDDQEYGENDKGLVRNILEKRTKKYNEDINDLIEDVNREDGAGKSYTGRFIWELLQNADDAADTKYISANLIGTKGLGFKSVLEITDEPEIYSSQFQFHFSQQKSRDMLASKVKKWKKEKGIPVCRLPHPIQPNSMIKKLIKNGYATIIRLPLKDGAREEVKNKLTAFRASWLLFCQHLDSVEIQINSTTRKITTRRWDNGRKITLNEDGNSEHWRIWHKTKKAHGEKQISVSVCLPIEEEKVQYCGEIPPLSVFFPTDKNISEVYAMIHASCEVDDNRKHLATVQPHDDNICKILKTITKDILSEVPASTALLAFGRARINNETEMLNRLGNSIAEAVRDTAFIPIIGGGRVKPDEVRLWKYQIGEAIDPTMVKSACLCDIEINENDECRGILVGLDADSMSNVEHAEMLRFCKTKTNSDCLATWRIAQAIMSEADPQELEECTAHICKAPLWRILNGNVRAAEGDVPLIHKKSKKFLDWLPVDVVDDAFRECIQNESDRLKIADEEWKDRLPSYARPLVGKRNYFKRILVPHCENRPMEWWQKNGWNIMGLMAEWGGCQDTSRIIKYDYEEENYTHVMHLPVGKGARQWAPAWQCYAGAAWGGMKIVDKYFASIEDRYVLSPSKDWKIEIGDGKQDEWKKRLLWLGCSWAPKMVRENQQHSKREFVNYTRWDYEFYFEHFEKMLSTAGKIRRSDYPLLLSNMLEMYEMACKNQACYQYYREHKIDSYAKIQLQKTEWVLCKPSLLYPNTKSFRPSEVYLPGSGLGGLLPEVDKRGVDDGEWHKIIEMLTGLNINDSISTDTSELMSYMNQLSQAKTKDVSEIVRAAKAIFDAYENTPSHPDIGSDVMVPCIRNTSRGEVIYFEEAMKVCWMDESYFNESSVRKEITRRSDLHIFFRFLAHGAKFGLTKLSIFLEMKPVHHNQLARQSELVRNRYQFRRSGLMKATNQTLPENLEIVAYDNITLRSAKHPEINPEIKFWIRDKSAIDISAKRESSMWRGLAQALGEVGECSVYTSDFAMLLAEPSHKDFLHLLGDFYDLTEESLEEIENEKAMTIEVSEEKYSDYNERDDFNQDRESSPGITELPVIIDQGEVMISESTESVPMRRRKIRPGTRSNRGGSGNAEAGMYAEQQVFNHLRKEYPNLCWKNKERKNNPGFDFLLKVPEATDGNEYIYFEVKSFADGRPSQVQLTRTQFEMAKEMRNNYRLYVVWCRNSDNWVLEVFPDPVRLPHTPVGNWALSLPALTDSD